VSGPIDVVEAAYDLGGNESDWLDRLARLAQPELDVGLGILAWTARLTEDRKVRIDSVASAGAKPGFEPLLRTVTDQLGDPELRATYHSGRVVSTASEAFSALGIDLETWPAFKPVLEYGMRDFLVVQGVDPGGFACNFGAILPRAAHSNGATARRWRAVSVHVLAALRLRTSLEALSVETADAVLAPDGRCLHAGDTHAKRAALGTFREAVKRIDRARGTLRRTDADGALSLWKGLVAGRWSLVDHFDTDSRRLLVARRNDPDIVEPRALTRRERQVVAYLAVGHSLKHIAYALGLAESTVSRARRSAMQKLRCPTVAKLMALLQTMGAPG
jgi:DNA-binding CsgD family transcriptional regulator